MPAQTKRHITLVGGDKGGVGKSSDCRCLAEYLDANKVQYLLYDGDDVNGTLTRFYKNARRLMTKTVKGFEPLLNNLDDEIGYQLVDLGGGTSQILTKFAKDTDFVNEVKSLKAEITLFFALAPNVDSINLLKIVSNVFPEFRFVLAKSLWETGTWDLWNDSMTRKALHDLGAIEIEIPELDGEAFSLVDRKSLTWKAAAEGANLPRVQRAYVSRWRKAVFEQFDLAKDFLLP